MSNERIGTYTCSINRTPRTWCTPTLPLAMCGHLAAFMTEIKDMALKSAALWVLRGGASLPI